MRENSATQSPSNIAPPPGFGADDEWEAGRILSKDEIRAWRLIYSHNRKVTDHDARVSIRAIQYSDGSLDDDLELIVIGASGDDPLNSDQARELAAAILDAAAQLDRLVQR